MTGFVSVINTASGRRAELYWSCIVVTLARSAAVAKLAYEWQPGTALAVLGEG